MKPKTIYIVIVAVLLVSARPGPGTTQESNPFLAMSITDLAQTWLLRECGIDDEPALEIAVTRQGKKLEPLFFGAWEKGPSDNLVREIREAALSRFERNRAALADTESLGLTSQDAKRASRRSVKDFVTRSVEDFETNYRSQALRGLFFAGGEQGMQLLDQVASDADSQFGDTARILLKRSKPIMQP